VKKFSVLLLLVLFFCHNPAFSAGELSPVEIANKLSKRFEGVEDYTCVADAHYRSGFLAEDKVFKVFFKRPQMVRIEVLAGDNAGAVAVLTKDLKVKGHAGGWLSWLVLSPPIDSTLVTTIRGHRLDQSHFLHLVNNIKIASTFEGVTAREEYLDGTKHYVLEGGLGESIGRIYIDPSRWQIKKVLEYEKGVEVVNVAYYDIVINPGLDEELFDL